MFVALQMGLWHLLTSSVSTFEDNPKRDGAVNTTYYSCALFTALTLAMIPHFYVYQVIREQFIYLL